MSWALHVRNYVGHRHKPAFCLCLKAVSVRVLNGLLTPPAAERIFPSITDSLFRLLEVIVFLEFTWEPTIGPSTATIHKPTQPVPRHNSEQPSTPLPPCLYLSKTVLTLGTQKPIFPLLCLFLNSQKTGYFNAHPYLGTREWHSPQLPCHSFLFPFNYSLLSFFFFSVKEKQSFGFHNISTVFHTED